MKIKEIVQDSIIFDNEENTMGLTLGDIDILAHNIATNLVMHPAVFPKGDKEIVLGLLDLMFEAQVQTPEDADQYIRSMGEDPDRPIQKTRNMIQSLIKDKYEQEEGKRISREKTA